MYGMKQFCAVPLWKLRLLIDFMIVVGYGLLELAALDHVTGILLNN